MKNKRSFSQLTKKILRADRGLQDPKLMHPAREWSIGLLISVITFMVCAGWGAQTYLKYRDASFKEVVEVGEGVVVYRESLVDAALGDFQQRTELHEGFLRSVEYEEVVEPAVEEIVPPDEAQATSTEAAVTEDNPTEFASSSEMVEVEE